MNEARSTPGPFEACKPGEYSDYKFNSIVVIGDDRRIAIVLGSDEESIANASLFAAAPDMLEALKLAEKWVDFLYKNGCDGGAVRGDLKTIRAAIAKAGNRS